MTVLLFSALLFTTLTLTLIYYLPIAQWSSRWTVSKNKPASEMGKWEATAGKWYSDSTNLALQTTEDARFYALSAPLANPFDNKGGDLVLQVSGDAMLI